MQENRVEYFAYGSNLNTSQMKERGTKVFGSERAKLPGWRLAFTYNSSIRNGGVLDIIPGENDDRVEGVIYIIDKESLKKLDIYEEREVQNGCEVGVYRRQFLPVVIGKKCKTVLTYVVNRTPEYKKKIHFPPSDEYMDTDVEGAKDHSG